MLRDIHKFNGKFTSIIEVKARLMEELEDEVPPTTKFSLGYFADGKQSMKKWLVKQQDLEEMYKLGCTEFLLWCDGVSDDKESQKRQKDTSPPPSKRAAKEMEVDTICSDLKELHKEKYSEPQFRLWARMISNGLHSSKSDPPQVPMIVGNSGNRSSKKSFEDTVANAVVAVTKAIAPTCTLPHSASESQTSSGSLSQTSLMGISPGKAVEIRGKCYTQLASLKQLFEESVIDETELKEQKSSILETLIKLS